MVKRFDCLLVKAALLVSREEKIRCRSHLFLSASRLLPRG